MPSSHVLALAYRDAASGVSVLARGEQTDLDLPTAALVEPPRRHDDQRVRRGSRKLPSRVDGDGSSPEARTGPPAADSVTMAFTQQVPARLLSPFMEDKSARNDHR
jgi:hypothetical protein